MSYQIISKKVYYHVINGEHCIFADERGKKKLLDIVLAVQIRRDWHIYAFCITDDSAYFVLEAENENAVSDGMQEVADAYLQLYEKMQWEQKGLSEESISGRTVRELPTLQDIASCCRKIHQIPLEEKYVRRLRDYWWSSYITYTGHYDWKMVDCHVLFLYFSTDREKAKCRLQKYHRTQLIGYNGEKVKL